MLHLGSRTFFTKQDQRFPKHAFVIRDDAMVEKV